MPPSVDFRIVALMLSLSLAIGGAGLAFPALEMLLQIAALATIAYFVATPRLWRFNKTTTVAMTILAAALLVPLVQLIPLPPPLWQTLPGRQLAADVDSALEWTVWRPWTLDIEATLRSFLRLLPAASIFLGSVFLPRSERFALLWIVAAFAVFEGALGLVQFATGGLLTPYPSRHVGYSLGLFVNRNHQSAFLLATMPVCGAIGAMQIVRGKPLVPISVLALTAMSIAAVSVIATTSRMALALLPAALATALVLLFVKRVPARVAAPALVSVAAVLLLVLAEGGLTRTLSRFSSLEDARFDFWINIGWALEHYGVAGTGVGTFPSIYQTAESLDGVGPAIVNHAHNDYLEILLDAGLIGAGLLISFLLLLGFVAIPWFRQMGDPARSLPRRASACGILLVLLSSLVDYPIRMPAIASCLAVFVVVLLPTRAARAAHVIVPHDGGPRAPARLCLMRVSALFGIGMLSIAVLGGGLSAMALRSQRYEAAVRWAPWSTQAHARLATAAIMRNEPAAGAEEAAAAVRLSPISAHALRSLGLARLAAGSKAQGELLMNAAASLGWRDPPTQLWAIAALERTGEPEKALQRAEALFRERVFVLPAFDELSAAPASQQMLDRLARDLGRTPPWRRGFFEDLSRLSDTQVPAVAKLIVALGKAPAPITPEELGPLLANLADEEKYGAAQQLWRASHPDNLLTNGDFESGGDATEEPGPAYWDVGRRRSSAVQLHKSNDDARGHFVSVAANDRSATLSQKIFLSPGQYRFTFDARVQPRGEAFVQWRLKCLQSGRAQQFEAAIASAPQWRTASVAITVPNQGCPIQRLALRRVRGIASQTLWLDNLRLR